MERIFGKPLVPQREIEKRVREIGAKITSDYEGKELMMICLLKGAYVFFADLVRTIHIPVSVDFMIVSSYGDRTSSSGAVKIISDITTDIKGKDVLIVEDIIDSGLTLDYLYKNLKARKPDTLRICALLNKAERRKYDVQLDYVGFKVPNKFVIGYGLDYQDKYRNLPYIAVLDVSDI